MSRALTPNAGLPYEARKGFWWLGAMWAAISIVGVVWFAGRAASWLTGNGFVGPDMSTDFVKTIVTEGTSAFWPNVPAAVIVILAVLIAGVVVGPVGYLIWRYQRRKAKPGDPLASLAGPAAVSHLTGKTVADTARRLRPSLAAADEAAKQTRKRNRAALKELKADGDKAAVKALKAKAAAAADAAKISMADCGVFLGYLEGTKKVGLYAGWEDVMVEIMAPRSGKTTTRSVPMMLAAPGPAVGTSSKSDFVLATAALRAERTGERVWIFDPQRVAFGKRDFYVDLLDRLRVTPTDEEARRLASHFIQEVKGSTKQGSQDFWVSAAEDLLSSLLLAAAVGHKTLQDVYVWLNHSTDRKPADILESVGLVAAASSLTGRQDGAETTREGVYETARTAASCLRDAEIMAWVTPPPFGTSVPKFDPQEFATSRQSLYLLSKEGAGSSRPLVAAIADRVMREAVRVAEARGGRLDPPMTVVLDEAANIAKIADLPALYSHLGSRGVCVTTILQSYRQGQLVWGDHGMDALWSAATVKMIGSGIDDARFAEDLSRLVGEHDVAVSSITHGSRTNPYSQQYSLHRRRILGPEKIRALPKGRALMLATGTVPALVRLQPWYTSDDADAIEAAIKTATTELTAEAAAAIDVDLTAAEAATIDVQTPAF